MTRVEWVLVRIPKRIVTTWAMFALPHLASVRMVDIDVAVVVMAVPVVPVMRVVARVMVVVAGVVPGRRDVVAHLEAIAVVGERAADAPVVDEGPAAGHLDAVQGVVQGQAVEVDGVVVGVRQQPADVAHARPRRQRPAGLAFQLLQGARSVSLVPAPGQVAYVTDPGHLPGQGPRSGERRYFDNAVMAVMERPIVGDVVPEMLSREFTVRKPPVWPWPVSVATPASTS